MTTRQAHPNDIDSDLGELRAALSGLLLPALQEDVLAALIGRRAPTRLLWRVGSLSHERLYASMDEICRDAGRFRQGRSVAAPAPVAAPRS